MKIVYLLPEGLSNPAGMERVTTIKANYLADECNYDISIVTTEQMGRPVYYPLSEKIHLHHLNIGIYKNFGRESYPRKIISRFLKTKEYKKALEKLLLKIEPDITISTLGIDIDFLSELKDKSIKIGELHFPGNFRELMAKKLHKGFIPNYIAKLRTSSLIQKCGKLSQLIVLTEEEKTLWSKTDNITVIPNPLPFYPKENSTLNNKAAIAVGRLSYEKGFDLLIQVWEIIHRKYPDWILNIYGKGEEKNNLTKLIKEKKLEKVVIINDPHPEIQSQYLKHSFSIFPTRYLDSFGMVIIEAMSCGLPVIAFDAPCGPKDIITEGINGFLVKTEDIHSMANKILTLIEFEDMRKSMGKKAKEMAEKYKAEKIMLQWINLFHELKK